MTTASGALTTRICTDVFAVEVSLRVAVSVTAAGLGTLAGAVYTPVSVTVPTVALPPTTPFTLQVNTVPGFPLSEAMN